MFQASSWSLTALKYYRQTFSEKADIGNLSIFMAADGRHDDKSESARFQIGERKPVWSRISVSSYKLEVFYVVITLISGLTLILFDRRPSRYDYEDHWNRVLQILSGHMTAIPNATGRGYGAISSSGDFTEFNNTAINSPFAYLPSLFSRGHFLAASILTLVFSVLFTVLAMRIAGCFRTVIFAVAIQPIYFLQIIYPTADAMTNTLCLLFIAFIIGLLQKKELAINSIISLSLLAICLGQLKSTSVIYMTLLALPFISFVKKEPKRSFALAIPGILCIASMMLWNKSIQGVAPAHGLTYPLYQERLGHMIHHPLGFIASCLQTLVQPLDTTGEAWDVGRNTQFFLGAETTQLPALTMIMFLIVFVVAVLRDSSRCVKLNLLQDCVVLGTICAVYAAVCLAMLASWGLGGYAHGIQSRYFVMVMPLGALLVPRFSSNVDIRKIILCLFSCSILGYIGLLLAHLLPF